jgi:fatty acid-binding protein DegV
MNIQVVTDSTSDMPEGLANEPVRSLPGSLDQRKRQAIADIVWGLVPK